MNSTALAQNFAIEKDGQAYYCISQSLTDSLIYRYHKGVIDSKLVVELRDSRSNWITEREALELALKACELANEATNDIVELSEEERALTKREIRRMKLKAVGDWFKNQWKLLTVGGGALGLGVGIGYLAK